MRRDDRDDPFDDIFREIERMMDEMMGNVQDQAGGYGAPPGQGGSGTHVDVYENEDEIRVVADLPGVEKDDISLQCDGEYVTIEAASTNRKYDERVPLPTRVDPESGSATYNNGVLEVAFDRSEDTTDISVQ
ncbi:MAG: Hsp20/alpha crystallin family protein [Halodesulfurarchaeum sp.]